MNTKQLTPLEQAIQDEAAAQTQPRELRRVSDTISKEIVDYCRARVGREIRMAWLQKHVVGRIQITQCATVQASSVDRVFRDLRQRGIIDYTCISRKESKYRIEWVEPEGGT